MGGWLEMSSENLGRCVLVLLAMATGCAGGSDLLGTSSGLDGGLTTDVLSERDSRRLCDWSVRTLGGEGKEYEAPCVADAPAGTTVDMVVLSVPECTRRLLAYESAAYTVMGFEECTHGFVDGGCGGGCLAFSIDYPDGGGVVHYPDAGR
jgi:hypothetical protein